VAGKIQRGFFALAQQHGVELVGGDTREARSIYA